MAVSAISAAMQSAPQRQRGSLLRVIGQDELAKQDRARESAAATPREEQALTSLANHIRKKWEDAKRHRDSAAGWNHRLLDAMRMFNGQYDPVKLAAIKQFQGSDVYARVVAVKCRGATSLLRDVYLSAERPWALEPTPEPEMPDDVATAAAQLIQSEAQSAMQQGVQVDQAQMVARMRALMADAERAARATAAEEAKRAQRQLDDLLVEGGFYTAFAEFLVDLPLFPFACIKGPVVRVVPDLKWVDGQAQVKQTARMFWERVSPFDIWMTPGVSDQSDAEIFQRLRLTRTDLNDVIGLPGYDEEAVREVLREYGQRGLVDWMDSTDSERADAERRENPTMNYSGMIDTLEYHGTVQGSMLLEHGFSKKMVEDEDRDYAVQAWIVRNSVLKVQFAPSPRKRHPYFMTSFEKVPGTIVGNALPDILTDLQDVANAALRALVNNLSISSGPQVTVNVDRLSDPTQADSLYPWKRWKVISDESGNNTDAPVAFFQPDSRAQELLGVYKEITNIADEISAIPRYITGSDRMGGAGRTASGLAMLMGNASKILQTVAANIDRDIFEPLLQQLYDMLLLTGNRGMLRGDENIAVKGVNVAIQKETERQRQLEFLQATANPIDFGIMGPVNRARLLRTTADTLGMVGETIVPTEAELKAQAAAQAAMPQPPPGQPGAPEQGEPKGAASPPATPGQRGPSLSLVQPSPQQ